MESVMDLISNFSVELTHNNQLWHSAQASGPMKGFSLIRNVLAAVLAGKLYKFDIMYEFGKK